MSPTNSSQYQAAVVAYVAGKGFSPSVNFNGSGSDVNKQTRVHSAQTYINYPFIEPQNEEGFAANK